MTDDADDDHPDEEGPDDGHGDDGDPGGGDEPTPDDRGRPDPGGRDPGGGGPRPEFDADEMGIEELREEIEDIDRELVELTARRTYVADAIGRVKERRGMATTDERQEERVMERAAENAELFDLDANLVKAIFRLLIELNKIEQRERR